MPLGHLEQLYYKTTYFSIVILLSYLVFLSLCNLLSHLNFLVYIGVIWTFAGFVYLTSIMDLYSRKIIAKVNKPLIIHTDRGRQYVCSDYINITADMQRSYSKKAYSWDNACIEAFHALIKRKWLNRFKIFDYNHAYKLIFQYI